MQSEKGDAPEEGRGQSDVRQLSGRQGQQLDQDISCRMLDCHFDREAPVELEDILLAGKSVKDVSPPLTRQQS